MIALSTLWNATKHENGRDLVREAAELGFPAIEVNYKITEPMFSDIASCIDRGEIRVVSLHNFTPLAGSFTKNQGGGDLYLLSSTDENHRKTAVEQTMRTIDHAAKVGAGVVVLHLGKTEEDVGGQTAQEHKLKSLIESDGGPVSQIEDLRTEIITKREAVKGPPLEAVFRSLDELAPYAGRHRVKLGIENRAHLSEIPSFDEIGAILEAFDPSNVGYWHDTGHAHIFENLGFAVHQEYCERFHSRLLGIHLHDSLNNYDHHVPGAGSIPFKMIAPYLNHTTFKVLEVNSGVTASEIQQGVTFLKHKGIQ